MKKNLILTLATVFIAHTLGATNPIELKTGPDHNFNPDAFGFNTQTAAGPSWDDPEFMQRLKELRPANLRYPGGTIGNYLDWRTGQYMAQDLRDPSGLPPRQGIRGPKGAKTINRYRLEEFRNGVQATGACPIYMLNMLTDTLSGSIDMLAHARELGLEVKYIELGNEFYLTYSQGGKAPDQIGDYARDFHYPTAESYATEAKRYITTLKKLYPEARFAYNAVIDKPKELWFNSSARTTGWNEVMKKSDIGADAVILHLYTSNASSPEGVIENSIREIHEFDTFTKEVFPDTKIWVTEYNIKCDMIDAEQTIYRNAFAGQWIHGMNSVVMTAELLMLPQIELLCFHDIAAGVPSAVVFASETQIPVSQGSKTYKQADAVTFSASGYAFSLLGYAMEGANRISRVTPNTSIKTNGIEALQGWLFTGENRRVLLINFSAKGQVISDTLAGGNSHAQKITQYSARQLTSVINRAAELKMSQSTPQNGKFLLQPYSIAVIDF